MVKLVVRKSKIASDKTTERRDEFAPEAEIATQDDSICFLCADRIRCHHWRAKAKCTGCQRMYHRSCVAFLPATEDKKHMTMLCPACRFLDCPQPNYRHPTEVLKPVSSFLRDGFYVFPSTVLIPEKLATITSFVTALFEEHWRAFKSQSDVRSMTKGFSNFRRRSPGRYEMVFPWLYEFISRMAVSSERKGGKNKKVKQQCDKVKACPIWMPILQCLLGEKLKLLASGVFLAMPGAKNQPFHTDGPALSAEYNLPCHAINLFIPLVDAGELNGTQIQPGSQYDPNKETIVSIKTAQADRKGGEKYIIPNVAAGGAYIFDYRVRHRGLANLTDVQRPCLYFTFTTDWFADTDNFSMKRYSKELELSPDFQRLQSSYLKACSD